MREYMVTYILPTKSNQIMSICVFTLQKWQKGVHLKVYLILGVVSMDTFVPLFSPKRKWRKFSTYHRRRSGRIQQHLYTVCSSYMYSSTKWTGVYTWPMCWSDTCWMCINYVVSYTAYVCQKDRRLKFIFTFNMQVCHEALSFQWMEQVQMKLRLIKLDNVRNNIIATC